jgi:hypothetical protein
VTLGKISWLKFVRMRTKHFAPVLRIHIGFSADANPDPAFYLYADPNADPGQTLKSQKVEFLFFTLEI